LETKHETTLPQFITKNPPVIREKGVKAAHLEPVFFVVLNLGSGENNRRKKERG
jgi:hypothetical protein